MYDEQSNDMGPGKKTIQFNVTYSPETVERINALCRELGYAEQPGVFSALATNIILTIRERQGIAPILQALVNRT